MYGQQKMMFEQNVRSCADRIISIYQPHLRPIVGALCLVFAKTGLETLKKRVLSTIDDLVGVLPSPQVSWGKINYRTLNRQVFCYIVVVNGAENIFKWYQYCCSNVLPLKDK